MIVTWSPCDTPAPGDSTSTGSGTAVSVRLLGVSSKLPSPASGKADETGAYGAFLPLWLPPSGSRTGEDCQGHIYYYQWLLLPPNISAVLSIYWNGPLLGSCWPYKTRCACASVSACLKFDEDSPFWAAALPRHDFMRTMGWERGQEWKEPHRLDLSARHKQRVSLTVQSGLCFQDCWFKYFLLLPAVVMLWIYFFSGGFHSPFVSHLPSPPPLSLSCCGHIFSNCLPPSPASEVLL